VYLFVYVWLYEKVKSFFNQVDNQWWYVNFAFSSSLEHFQEEFEDVSKEDQVSSCLVITCILINVDNTLDS